MPSRPSDRYLARSRWDALTAWRVGCMVESQQDVLKSARATPWAGAGRWLVIFLGSAALAALAVGLGFLSGSYRQWAERDEAMRLLKIKGYGSASQSLKRI